MSELVTIEKVGSRGDGVAHLDGRTVYVPFSAPGDVLRVTPGKETSAGIAAEIDEIVTPAPSRIKPACRHFGMCGGCALQHLDDGTYAAWKRDLVREALAHRGLPDAEVAAPLISPRGRRRRVEFVALRRKKGAMVGFHVRRSHQVFDVGTCPVLAPELVALLKPLRALLSEVMPRNSEADIAATATEGGVDLLIKGDLSPDLEQRERLAAFAEDLDLARLTLASPKQNFVEPVAARRPAIVRFAGVAVEPPPGAFLQATKEGEEALANAVLDGIGEARRIADLFAGCGSFTFPLALGAGHPQVTAVEGDEALADALKTASNRAQANVAVEVRDLFRRPLDAEELKDFDAVVIDPPRAGAAAQVAEVAKSAVPVLAMVSCNPATFARDLHALVEGGYVLEKVTPVDQFLWSAHVEVVAILRRS